MRFLLCPLIAFCLAACDRQAAAPLPQRAYVWQRQWTPPVSMAAAQADDKLNGLVVFGAEISWDQGKPKTFHTSIDWAGLRSLKQPVGLALRIGPYPGPFEDEAVAIELSKVATALVERARKEGVDCAEMQVDFDCAQKKLAGYALCLPRLREAIKPTPLVITTLPSWLGEPAFPKLLDQADGYVLQVHSIMPEKSSPRALVCDPERARAWVAKASALKRPFTVALSTYSGVAGYDADGRWLGLALDGVQPAWPSGTKVMQFRSDAPAMAALVREWQAERPAHLREIIWYRLPVSSDRRNWRWPTFVAVVDGREPERRLTVRMEGENPRDLSLVNEGESDEDLDGMAVLCTWEGGAPMAVEALPGWTVTQDRQRITFTLIPQPTEPLPPGGRRGIGWLRFQQPAPVHAQIVR